MLGSVILIELAVVLLWSTLLTTLSVSFAAFGLDFVPALLGETEAVTVIDGGSDLGVGRSGPAERERRRTSGHEGLAQEELLRRFGFWTEGRTADLTAAARRHLQHVKTTKVSLLASRFYAR